MRPRVARPDPRLRAPIARRSCRASSRRTSRSVNCGAQRAVRLDNRAGPAARRADLSTGGGALAASSRRHWPTSLARRLRMFVLRARSQCDLSGPRACSVSRATPRPASLQLDGARLPAEPLVLRRRPGLVATRVGGDPARVLVAANASRRLIELAAALRPKRRRREWRLADIRAGLPHRSPGRPRLHSADGESRSVGGVSFDKGCYSGQEIVTRTRHLGRVKRRMLRFRCDGRSAPVPAIRSSDPSAKPARSSPRPSHRRRRGIAGGDPAR